MTLGGGTAGVKREPPAVRSATWSVVMAEADPWLEHYGERRRAPRPSRRLRHALVLAMAVAVLAGALALAASRSGGWRPPSGLGGFRDCTYGGRVKARCTSVGGLHVAIIPATRQPALGALFYLEGGPGGAASDAAVSVGEVFANVSEYRDIVLADQRGTGGSQRVACPQEHVRAMDGGAVTSYLRRCFANLRGGVQRLTTASAAADLERVRRALGYGRIDVYGSSYGATLAQIYLRRYPRSVRTATLDGASLAEAPVYELAARNAEHALRLVLARCVAQPACRRRFPDTRADLARVLARDPERADDLATTVAVLLRSPEDGARVPLLVREAAAGNGAPLAREFADRVGAELDARSRLPMFWVTICGESWARFDVGETVRASGGSFLAHASAARARLFRQACDAVPRSAHPSARSWSTRVPVLLLAGEADPQDPPANLAGWHGTFPDGRLVTVGGLAHGVIAYGCLRLVVARFVAGGTAHGLDASCTRRVPLPRFELS
jgi:pimeloyl-ACP methyl ester carboxylesterase